MTKVHLDEMKDKKEDNIEDLLAEFHRRFPFRRKPSSIDNLTQGKLYKPFHKTSFFYWLETKLRPFGSLNLYSKKPWVSAQKEIKTFQSLLRLLMDDKKSIHEKIDAPWEKISGFGGDRHNAKKILCCYYPDGLVPIFNTAHMESFIKKLGLDKRSKSKELFKEDYKNLSLGKKYQVLTELFLQFKKTHSRFASIPNVNFMKYLYGKIKDKEHLGEKWKPEAPEIILAKTSKGLLEYEEPKIKNLIKLTKAVKNSKKNSEPKDRARNDDRNRMLGRIGEELVLKMEKNKLRKLKLVSLCEKVRWVSDETKDGAEYDILSFNEKGREIFIEVKTTTGNFDRPFYATSTQVNFSNMKRDKYYLYRIYNFDPKTKRGKYFIRKGSLTQHFNLASSQYQAVVIK